jgi:CelD/BcsL family acetyltransferase involved in cellulose biosynthesis
MTRLVSSYTNGLEVVSPAAQKVATVSLQARFERAEGLCPREYLLPWSNMVARGPFSEPFYQPEWFRAGVETHAEYNTRYILSAWENDNLRAILPLMQEQQTVRGLPVRVLRSLSWIHSYRFDLMHDGDTPEHAAVCIWRALFERKEEWDALEFLDVPSNGALNYLVQAALDDNYLFYVWPTRRTPILTLPEGNNPYANCPKESKRYRSRLKSKFRKLGDLGDVTFGPTFESPQRAFEEFVSLESKGWKGKRKTAIASNDKVLHYYQSLAHEFARRKELLPYALRLNGKAIAMHFGLYLDGTYYAPKVAYDEKYAKLSPGQLLVNKVVEDLGARNAQKIDFLGPTAPWKSVWANDSYAHTNIYIIRPTVYGKLAGLLPLRCMRAVRSVRDFVFGDPQERGL